MVLLMEIKLGINLVDLPISNDGIVYSPNKYRETEGIKDIGSHFWNYGRTEEIKERYVHLGGDD